MMVVWITSVVSTLGVIIAAWFTFRGKRGENKVGEIAHILEGYKEIVTALQSEIKRLEEKIESLIAEQEECDRRNNEMQFEIEVLKKEVALWSGEKKP